MSQSTMADKITGWIGTPTSVFIHSLCFLGIYSLRFFDYSFDDINLILTTIVSLEAIYLSLFIQMSVNRQHQTIQDVKEDIGEISEDVEEISEKVDDVQEDIEEIEKNVDEIEEDVEAIEKDVDDVQEDIEEIEKNVDEIEEDVEAIEKDVDEIEEDVKELTEEEQQASDNDKINHRLEEIEKSLAYIINKLK